MSTVSRGYTHPLRVYTRFASVLCPFIRWLVMQEVCRHFEFARHFESHLARPPPLLYAHANTTTSDEHSIVTMLHSTRIIFSTYSFKAGTYPRITQSIWPAHIYLFYVSDLK